MASATGSRNYGSPQSMSNQGAWSGAGAGSQPHQAAYGHQQAQYGQQQSAYGTYPYGAPGSGYGQQQRQAPPQQWQQHHGQQGTMGLWGTPQFHFEDRPRPSDAHRHHAAGGPSDVADAGAPVHQDRPVGWKMIASARQKLHNFDAILDDSFFSNPLPAFLVGGAVNESTFFPSGNSPVCTVGRGYAYQQMTQQCTNGLAGPNQGTSGQFDVHAVRSRNGISQPRAKGNTWSSESHPLGHGGPTNPFESWQSAWKTLVKSIEALTDASCGAHSWCNDAHRDNLGTPRFARPQVIENRCVNDGPNLGAMTGVNRRSWYLRTLPPTNVGAENGGNPSPLVAREDNTEMHRDGNVGADACHLPQPRERTMSQHHVREVLRLNRSSMCSLKGNKPSSANQDRAACVSLAGNSAQLFAVLDGHGEEGHSVAEVLIEVLPKMILKALHGLGRNHGSSNSGPRNPQDGGDGQLDMREVISQSVIQSFLETHHLLECVTSATLSDQSSGMVSPRDSSESGSPARNNGSGLSPSGADASARWNRFKIDARASGTTATVVLLLPPQRALIAHVGDSRAVFGVRPRGDIGSRWRTLELTRDHKPDLPEERARIEETGAQVTVLGQPPVTVTRVITPQQGWPAINMSRSIGDLHAHTQGLTATAEVRLIEQLWDAALEDAVLIIASDGVWDVMQANEAVELLTQQEWDAAADPAAALTREAYERWGRRGLQGQYVDDITAVVKFL
eukprot:gnl/TRDRNA2_/TRDRNA2_81919_c0_seq1.p1 gnl/TRDRNA2_/TRDRNA2_81919_c0~~gnl/TRDRNA2_/TRDRNA2_81919_c0_seq1.p1  ORF type:complete len:733 (-),score=88.38 gnl/TRDRNA2_/TRDRNA2_81919_c0_seq1:53-2251(-)